MHKAIINKVEKVRHQATNTDFLDVSFDIIDEEGSVLDSKRIGMDVQATTEDVVEMVNSHIVEYGHELENAQLDLKRQKANANVKDMQENLVGSTIAPSQPVEGEE